MLVVCVVMACDVGCVFGRRIISVLFDFKICDERCLMMIEHGISFFRILYIYATEDITIYDLILFPLVDRS